MSADSVLFEVDQDNVARITLNRPAIRNAFDEEMIARLQGLLTEIADRPDIIAVVLRGEGASFSAGADLNWMKRAASYGEAQNLDDALALARMLNTLNTLPKVTIACVQGAAMGGGLGLVACCDIVIAEKDAQFALSEVKLGLIPATIAPYVLKAMGERAFRRYAQTGERFDAHKAHEIGLVHEISERSEETGFLLHTIIDHIKANGPLAMAQSKQLALDFAGQPVTEAIGNDTAARIARVRMGAEAKEGLEAFLGKRKPVWPRI